MKKLMLMITMLAMVIMVRPARVVTNVDNVVIVETRDGNLWGYRGCTKRKNVYLVFKGNKIINVF